MNNGWTGGQYSLLRIGFGLFLFIALVRAPYHAFAPSPPLADSYPNAFFAVDTAVIAVLLGVGVALSLLLFVGYWDRLAALLLAGLWFSCFGPPTFGSKVGWVVPGILLLAHTCLPSAPYGSWAARGGTNPGGSWRFPRAVYAAAWGLLVFLYVQDGFFRLANLTLPEHLATMTRYFWPFPFLEFAFCPLVLWRRGRPVAWVVLLLVQVAALFLGETPGSHAGFVLLHLFTFDPAWVRPTPDAPARVYYDGGCGLCHRGVRFLLAEDRTGTAFRFSPLDGETFQSAVPADERQLLPDSMVVQTGNGAVLIRSDAVRFVARRLGGLWRVFAEVSRLIPRGVWDWLYDRIAATRYRLFAPPAGACPLASPDVRNRFDP